MVIFLYGKADWVTQNKLVRYILHCDARQHLGYDDFVIAKYISVENRVDYLTVCMMHTFYHGEAPSYAYKSACVTHSHVTRNSTMSFIVPQVKRQGPKSFIYNGRKLWNSIPSYTRQITSKEDLKFKCHMFNVMSHERQFKIQCHVIVIRNLSLHCIYILLLYVVC